MTSEKRRAANWSNALSSTGPKTPAGKMRSSRNAMKHGLRSRYVLLEDEDEELFVRMRSELLAELRPQGEMETFLALRIAAGIWRLSRVLRVEQEIFQERIGAVFQGEKTPGKAFLMDCCNGVNAFFKLSRYEGEIDRGVTRALHELQRLQTARNGGNMRDSLELDAALSRLEAP